MKNKVCRLVISAILSIAMILTMAACGDKPTPSPSPSPTTTPTTTPTTPTTSPSPSPLTNDEAELESKFGITFPSYENAMVNFDLVEDPADLDTKVSLWDYVNIPANYGTDFEVAKDSETGFGFTRGYYNGPLSKAKYSSTPVDELVIGISVPAAGVNHAYDLYFNELGVENGSEVAGTAAAGTATLFDGTPTAVGHIGSAFSLGVKVSAVDFEGKKIDASSMTNIDAALSAYDAVDGEILDLLTGATAGVNVVDNIKMDATDLRTFQLRPTKAGVYTVIYTIKVNAIARQYGLLKTEKENKTYVVTKTYTVNKLPITVVGDTKYEKVTTSNGVVIAGHKYFDGVTAISSGARLKVIENQMGVDSKYEFGLNPFGVDLSHVGSYEMPLELADAKTHAAMETKSLVASDFELSFVNGKCVVYNQVDIEHARNAWEDVWNASLSYDKDKLAAGKAAYEGLTDTQRYLLEHNSSTTKYLSAVDADWTTALGYDLITDDKKAEGNPTAGKDKEVKDAYGAVWYWPTAVYDTDLVHIPGIAGTQDKFKVNLYDSERAQLKADYAKLTDESNKIIDNPAELAAIEDFISNLKMDNADPTIGSVSDYVFIRGIDYMLNGAYADATAIGNGAYPWVNTDGVTDLDYEAWVENSEDPDITTPDRFFAMHERSVSTVEDAFLTDYTTDRKLLIDNDGDDVGLLVSYLTSFQTSTYNEIVKQYELYSKAYEKLTARQQKAIEVGSSDIELFAAAADISYKKEFVIISGLYAQICEIQNILTKTISGYDLYKITDAPATKQAVVARLGFDFLEDGSWYPIALDADTYTDNALKATSYKTALDAAGAPISAKESFDSAYSYLPYAAGAGGTEASESLIDVLFGTLYDGTSKGVRSSHLALADQLVSAYRATIDKYVELEKALTEAKNAFLQSLTGSARRYIYVTFDGFYVVSVSEGQIFVSDAALAAGGIGELYKDETGTTTRDTSAIDWANSKFNGIGVSIDFSAQGKKATADFIAAAIKPVNSELVAAFKGLTIYDSDTWTSMEAAGTEPDPSGVSDTLWGAALNGVEFDGSEYQAH